MIKQNPFYPKFEIIYHIWIKLTGRQRSLDPVGFIEVFTEKPIDLNQALFLSFRARPLHHLFFLRKITKFAGQ